MNVEGKTILLGVSGGIAAYKACTICSQLVQQGADVHVIMTSSAQKFVQPLTFQSLSRNNVHIDTFDELDASIIAHIDLADRTDLAIVAPATANVIGKLAHGLADDMLTTTLLATTAPVWMAPAMNVNMYAHPAVKDNIRILQQRGVRFVEPGEGQLACGYTGKGRLAEPEEIMTLIHRHFEQTSSSHDETSNWWQGKHVLITAGPTQEEIDAVRYLSNYSSGKMGYALAEACAHQQAQVTMISGRVSLQEPENVQVIQVQSAEEMRAQVLARYAQCDVIIKAAAVSDYRPETVKKNKLKKTDDSIHLKLVRTEDILMELGLRKQHQILVGFAAETDDVQQYAQEKMQRKNLDYIVANDVSQQGAGFGGDTNIVSVYSHRGLEVSLPMMSKTETARRILEIIASEQTKNRTDDDHDS